MILSMLVWNIITTQVLNKNRQKFDNYRDILKILIVEFKEDSHLKEL